LKRARHRRPQQHKILFKGNHMSKIDQTFVLGSSTIEFHVGNAPGSPGQSNGQNPQDPGSAPILKPNAATPAAANPKSGVFAGVKFQIPA